MSPDRPAHAEIGDHGNKYRADGGSSEAELEGVLKREPRLAELEKDEAPVFQGQILEPHGTGPVLHECRPQQHAVRQHDRAAENEREQRQRRNLPRAEAQQTRRRCLAADDRVTPPPHDRRLRFQKHDGDREQRQGDCRGEPQPRRKLEQAPDLGRHRIDARRKRQDRRRTEKRHRLQKRDQITGEKRRRHQWKRHIERGSPRRHAQYRGRFLELPGNEVETIGDEGKDVGKGVEHHHEHHSARGKDVEERRGLEGFKPEQRVVPLIDQARVGPSEQDPRECPKERWRNERREDQDSQQPLAGQIRARHQPAHRSGDRHAENAHRGRRP